MLLRVLFASQILRVKADSQCAPVTWDSDGELGVVQGDGNSTSATPQSGTTLSMIRKGNLSPGDVHCRYATMTEETVNYHTRAKLMEKYRITNDIFFTLNPSLSRDCSNIRPKAAYCVRGYIEPLGSSDGRCGPMHNNATCRGTDQQCCNVDTWTNEPADCADGTCYEGACLGDKRYSTDGTCGHQHGDRLCAGKWGDCCSRGGRCRSGEAFCAFDMCQTGNCVRPPPPPPMVWGNSTDGSCGGPNKYTCDVVLGPCCGKNGKCGGGLAYCGQGCQPAFGTCRPPSSVGQSSGSITPTTTSKLPAVSTTVTSRSTTKQITSSTSKLLSTSTSTGLVSLPSCGQTCFKNMLAQYSQLGCTSQDAYCLCNKPNFGLGLRDYSNGACGTQAASAVTAFGSSYCASASATAQSTALPTGSGVMSLPGCGQTYFKNMTAQYSQLGCASAQPACLCSNTNFHNGLRDCSNGVCGAAVASTVISFGISYCASATAGL